MPYECDRKRVRDENVDHFWLLAKGCTRNREEIRRALCKPVLLKHDQTQSAPSFLGGAKLAQNRQMA